MMCHRRQRRNGCMWSGQVVARVSAAISSAASNHAGQPKLVEALDVLERGVGALANFVATEPADEPGLTERPPDHDDRIQRRVGGDV